MAQTVTAFHGNGFSLRALAARVAAGVSRAVVRMTEAGPHAAEIKRLNALSDAQLAAMGKTRAGEVRRIFGAHYYI
ncbi:MAG: hypothetical protein GC146_01220 [Limimaricola sp.]|uniref:hypothetical protein n=1 Tax=Limimaricola sp. TaxID=2211665 RepID=UPI001D9AE553|nr:hypothetical protein [Limimaricola sp.]MBI1415819.1 hypothetical protein [Limimaricola sp.]